MHLVLVKKHRGIFFKLMKLYGHTDLHIKKNTPTSDYFAYMPYTVNEFAEKFLQNKCLY